MPNEKDRVLDDERKLTRNPRNTETAEQRARWALHHSPIYDLRKLRVEQAGESLLISGAVSSFYHKQLAQELVLGVAQDTQVVNTVDVR